MLLVVLTACRTGPSVAASEPDAPAPPSRSTRREDVVAVKAPSAAMLQLDEAARALRNHRLKTAARIYSAVLAADPEQPDALAGLARVRLAENDFSEAEALLRRAVQRREGDARAWQALGLALARQEEHAEAAKACGRAFELDPRNGSVGLAYGHELAQAGALGQAERVLREVVDLDPMTQFVFTELGDVLRAQGRLDEALQLYLRARETYASDKRAIAGAALVHEAKGDACRARAAWKDYVSRDCCSDFAEQTARPKAAAVEPKCP